MAQEEQKMQGITMKDVFDYVDSKGPLQLREDVDDFIKDMKNICASIDTLYEDKVVPLSIRGFAVSVKIIDQNSNEDYFVHEVGKSATGKSLMQHIREIIGDVE